MSDFLKSIKIATVVGLGVMTACDSEPKAPANSKDKIGLKGDKEFDNSATITNNFENNVKAKKVLKSADSMANMSFYDGLLDVQTVNPKIRVDLKYATTDNFMKIQLYDTLRKAYLQREVAFRLAKCQDYLSSLHPDLYLLVYDAIRPVSVQRKMWNALDTIPVAQRGKFVSNPANGSIHNYGAAVDLTICKKDGIPLDMGAGYDDIRLIAYPSKEVYFLNKGELTEQHIANRVLLRKVMASQNFKNIATEWWHFNAFSRNVAKAKYKPLL